MEKCFIISGPELTFKTKNSFYRPNLSGTKDIVDFMNLQ